MLSMLEIETGNWFHYIPNGNYCTVKAKGDILTMEGFSGSFQCNIDELRPIKVNIHMPTLFGFKQSSETFTKEITPALSLDLFFDAHHIAVLEDSDGNAYRVGFVHEFQNIYFKITREKILPNLYGVKE